MLAWILQGRIQIKKKFSLDSFHELRVRHQHRHGLAGETDLKLRSTAAFPHRKHHDLHLELVINPTSHRSALPYPKSTL